MESEGRLSLAQARYSEALLREYTPEVLQDILVPAQAVRDKTGGNVPVICDPFCKHRDTQVCPHGAARAPKSKGFCSSFALAATTIDEVEQMLEQQFQGLLVDVN